MPVKPNPPEKMQPREVGKRLAKLRALNNLSATDCWRALKMQPSAWSAYESGGRALPAITAAMIANHFGVTLDYLYLGDRRALPFDLARKLENGNPDGPDT
jgi:transcriptional regulator with XRE-family HTH domain